MNEINVSKLGSSTQNTKHVDNKIKSNDSKINTNSNAAVVTNTPKEAAVVYEPSIVKDELENYDKKGHIYNKSRIDELKSESDAKLNQLKEAVKSMIEAQGYKFEDIMNLLNNPDSITEDGKLIDENGNEITINIDDETRQNAIDAISEDGYYGVKQTSSRMIEFAKIISGNNPSKLETIKEAITAGFEAAKENFGGELPDISQKTYDAVMDGLDKWANGDESSVVGAAKDNLTDSRIK